MKKEKTTATSGIPVQNKLPKLRIEKLEFLKSIAGLVAHTSTMAATGGIMGWAGMTEKIAEIAGAVRLETDRGTKLWQLIVRSLTRALVQLITESNGVWQAEDIETGDLDKRFEACLSAGEYTIDTGFFTNPSAIPLINDLKPIIQDYLGCFGFTPIQRRNILNRLNSYFIFALKKEWASNFEAYAEIREVLNNPFRGVEEQELNWDIYLGELEREIHKSVFGETFSLQQVFIPLRACYKKQQKKKDKTEEEEVVVDLQKHLLQWLAKEDRQDAIRIIRGGPGYGKSSCLKMLAAHLAANRQKVIFIPLHRFDVTGKMDEAVRQFLRYDRFLSHDVFREEEKLILLFDGLDELSMQGRVLADVAQSFLREVEKCVTNFNNRQLRLQVIISGRDVIIQQNEQDFREEGQILRLLPYYVPVKKKEGEVIDSDVDVKEKWNDPQKLLRVDQRHLWWKKYGDVTGVSYPSLPQELQTRELDEITAQPLLNFLVALSYQRGKIAFTKQTNLNEVYADLLEAVYERGYSEGKKHQAVSRMDARHFGIILEEIALCAWQGTGRTTTVKEINAHFEDGGLTPLLARFISDAEKGVISLLVAFYFRQAGQTVEGAQTFEFTHKSFGEYLTARRMVRKLEQVHKKWQQDKEDLYDQNGWNVRQCLIEWIKVFGKQSPDADLVRFIRNELKIMANQNKENLLPLQQTITGLWEYILLKGMPMEHFSKFTYYEANQEAIHGERAILIFHSLLAWITGEISSIRWPNPGSFSGFITRVAGPRMGYQQFMLRFCNHLNLTDCILMFGDFYGADFSFSCLVQANLAGANLAGANLMSVDLDTAFLAGVPLMNANLQLANLRNAYLRNADLKRADLERADLEGADLEKANLEGADLEGADLEGANLEKANLEGADLEGADLEGANFKNTILDKSRKK